MKIAAAGREGVVGGKGRETFFYCNFFPVSLRRLSLNVTPSINAMIATSMQSCWGEKKMLFLIVQTGRRDGGRT